uniref:Uncharacterized protein n=1 Tax=Arundo donax TaxID=35708 RepID=A0A0A9AZ56_ARUDO
MTKALGLYATLATQLQVICFSTSKFVLFFISNICKLLLRQDGLVNSLLDLTLSTDLVLRRISVWHIIRHC